LVVDRRTIDVHLQELETAVRLLRQEAARTLEQLMEDPVRAFGVQHLLQISIEGLANISNHLAAECGWETPRSYLASFANLHRHGVVPDAELAERLEQMARFRNLVVHRYWKVDMAEVYRILQHHLADLTAAGEAVARYLAAHPDV
jgi:uncharacterized protein YutE (UPF0331/DUF86 family)